MWSPTHVHVIVQRAENLLIKGKNETNNAFVVIEMGNESYRTSIKDKSGPSVTWSEDCELKIPKIGNKAAIVLTAFHRNSLGLDQFLGTVKIPLESFDKFHKTTHWYRLEGKPGKEKGKDKIRGELQVEIGFISSQQSQSLTSLQSKQKRSFEQLTGSLFGLRNSDRRIGVKKFANALGRSRFNKKQKETSNVEIFEENDSHVINNQTKKNYNNLDPGVISDEDDSTSHKSSESLGNSTESPQGPFNTPTPPPKPRRTYLNNPQISVSHWEDDNKTQLNSYLNISQDSMRSTGSRKNRSRLEDLRGRLSDRRLSISCVDFAHLATPKPEKKFSSTLQLEKSQGESHKGLSKLAKKIRSFHSIDKKEVKRMVDGCEAVSCGTDLTVTKSEFKNKNKEELISMVVDLQKRVNCISVRVKDMEDYLDEILLKVMETVPRLLEKS